MRRDARAGHRRLRRAWGLDERDRPGARPGRLLRDRRRLHRRRDGAAISAKRKGRVAVAFFGDGATNQGYFHECLNLAAVVAAAGGLRLREQPLRRVHADGATCTAGGDIAARAAAYGLPVGKVDGNDVRALQAAPPGRGARPRGQGPAFLECLTYRHSATRRATPRRYRPMASSSEWKRARPAQAGGGAAARGGRPRGADRGGRRATSSASSTQAVETRAGRARSRIPENDAATEYTHDR